MLNKCGAYSAKQGLSIHSSAPVPVPV